MQTISQTFGLSGDELALADHYDPQTPQTRTVSTAPGSVTTAAAISATRSLIDPHGSAMFWIAAAAVLGLVLVTGQIRVQAALATRAGRRGKR